MLKTGPYLRSTLTVEKIMIDVLISLTPALLAGVVFFGWRALGIVLLSTATAILTEAILLRAPFTFRGIFGDGSAAVSGFLLGLTLPATSAWWIPVVGSFLAISLLKLAFGGLGYNIFNPALGARAILLLAFTSQLVRFSAPFDTLTIATPLLSSKSFSWPLFFGNVGGSIGETSVVAILLGGLYLLSKGHINWRIPLGYVGSAFVLALLWGLDPWYTITAGGLLFAAVFMATDMVTSPVTFGGQLIFGIGCGLLTVIIRQYTPFPEGVTFAVLTMNALAPLIESLTVPIPFGVGLAREIRVKGVVISTVIVLVLLGALVWLDKIQPSVTPILGYGRHLPIPELLGSNDYEVVENGGLPYYVTWDDQKKPARAVFLAEQSGFNGPIQFLVVLDHEQNIEDLQILEHQEDPGLGELITKEAFLGQFIGKSRESELALGRDIQGVSGATISSRSFTLGVRRALEEFERTFFPQEEIPALWRDGTYLGSADSFGGQLEVEVLVVEGKIADVQVKAHSDTPSISEGAMVNIPERIVAANAPRVDVVSGATISSEAIMAAVERALDEAEGPEEAVETARAFSLPALEGTYRGEGQGFGGKLVLDVVVEGGKIVDLQVVESQETPFVAEGALEQLLPALLERQSPVEAVSGATKTSAAVLEALTQALEGEPLPKAAPEQEPFRVPAQEGTYRGEGQGFGGKLVLDVVVEGGKIVDLQVVESQETPFVAEGALEQLLPALLERQSPVEAVSGATKTSAAVLEALTQALEGEPLPKAAPEQEPFRVPAQEGTYRGEGQGFGGKLVLDVVVEGGKIVDLQVVESQETPFVAEGALEQLLPALLERQSPVEAVSGATKTSAAVLEALTQALEGEPLPKAAPEQEPFRVPAQEGTYRGEGQGFGGKLVLDVVVEGGKIVDLQVVESQETPFVAEGALEQLLPALLERQSPVEAVSGATKTSAAVLEALTQALEGEPLPKAAPEQEPFRVPAQEGTYRGEGQGFGGKLVLDVVVEGGKIVDLQVVESQETPFVAEGALEQLLPALLERQSPVEAVSGATKTSAAVLEAINNALEEGDQ